MKTVSTTLYSFTELSPEAQDRVIENEAKFIFEDPDNFTLNECMDSLHAIVKACGERLYNWSVGPYSRSHASIRHGEEWDGGNKTVARFVRMLMFHGYSRPKRFKDMQFPGICGFTGICFDEDVAETMLSALLDGESLSRAADRAAERIAEICEEDLEYRTSREGILEMLDQSAEIYTADGEIF